jgi:O-methyltransferase involved in polyketide biosynthesis
VYSLATSVFETDWMDAIRPTSPPPLIVAEGVLAYFTEDQVRRLVLVLRERFPSAELITDAYSPFMVWTHNRELRANRVEARLRWALKHPRDPQAWAPGIRLLREYHFFDQPEPRLGAMRWLRYIPFLAHGVGIYHYLLGGASDEART